MYSTVYDLLPPLDQFVDVVLPEIGQSAIEKIIQPDFKILFVIEGKCCFDDLGMGPGVVVEQDDLALSFRPLMPNDLI
ncbi:unnamed protein product [Ceratitis capitata]|uniref:(Mediterranean fruit fly) hypothetical protein n=1 Tax=Ceratitis capitata TaxID=7213 RepID=A0A811UEV4_CERCA|nr:unnamed protein product [Ceratitis capitata]